MWDIHLCVYSFLMPSSFCNKWPGYDNLLEKKPSSLPPPWTVELIKIQIDD